MRSHKVDTLQGNAEMKWDGTLVLIITVNIEGEVWPQIKLRYVVVHNELIHVT